MCVAIFKPAGAETPSLTILKECWEKNPDGAGVAVSERQSVYYRKGFMKFSELEDFYYANNLSGRTGQAMVFHFRIGTHGVKDAGNTHPFMVTDDPVLLRQLTGRTSSVVAHNGVFRDEPKLPKISDTGQFIVNAVRESEGDIVKHWNTHPATIGWSKLVILLPANRFKLLGSWSMESDNSCGCIFSNMIWKPYTAPKGGYYYGCYGGRGGYDDDFPSEFDMCGGNSHYVSKKDNPLYKQCVACKGSGIASTGRVRCHVCNGQGYVLKTLAEQKADAKKKTQAIKFITAEEGHQPHPEGGSVAEAAKRLFQKGDKPDAKPVLKVSKEGIKVWDKDKKDYVLMEAKA